MSHGAEIHGAIWVARVVIFGVGDDADDFEVARLGNASHDTLCHLIYPASTPWQATSATDIVLYDKSGHEVARERVAIPCSGSQFWRYHEVFAEPTRDRAGNDAYIIIRDATCRLFGYHGLLAQDGAFSLDHMFGF